MNFQAGAVLMPFSMFCLAQKVLEEVISLRNKCLHLQLLNDKLEVLECYRRGARNRSLHVTA